MADDGVGDRHAGGSAADRDPDAVALPILIFQIFTNFDALATAFAAGATAPLAWARRRPGLAGVVIRAPGGGELYPLLLLIPLALLAVVRHRLREVGKAPAPPAPPAAPAPARPARPPARRRPSSRPPPARPPARPPPPFCSHTHTRARRAW